MTGKGRVFLTSGIILGSIVVSAITTVAVIHFNVKKSISIIYDKKETNIGETITLEAKTHAFRVSDTFTYTWLVNGEELSDSQYQNQPKIEVVQEIGGTYEYTLIVHSKKENKEYKENISLTWTPEPTNITNFNDQFYQAIISKVSKEWNLIENKTNIESELVTSFNEILASNSQELKVKSITISLEDSEEYGFKIANINIEFDSQIQGEFDNFNLENKNYNLVIKQPIETGIYNQINDEGKLVLDESSLETINNLILKYVVPVYGLNGNDSNLGNFDTSVGGEEIKQEIIASMNQELPKGFPPINHIALWGASSGIGSADGFKTAKFNLGFDVVTNSNGIEIQEDNSLGWQLSTYQSKLYLITSPIKLEIPA